VVVNSTDSETVLAWLHLRNMLHVLVVEDNSADALVVSEAIGSCTANADVVIARDGEQALRFLTEFNFDPDVIFLDLNLPKFNGLQVLERSRANTGSSVIVLTCSANPADKTRAVALGAQEYIVKSLDLDCFLGAVSGALKRWAGNAARRGV
jgi:CheY-like chemotaxis protein